MGEVYLHVERPHFSIISSHLYIINDDMFTMLSRRFILIASSQYWFSRRRQRMVISFDYLSSMQQNTNFTCGSAGYFTTIISVPSIFTKECEILNLY